MNTSALILGVPAALIAAALLFTAPRSGSAPPVAETLTDLDDAPDLPAPETSGPIWLDSLELATSIAAKKDRPIMVVFR